MKRTTAGALLLVGAVCLGSEARERVTAYDNENIWKRQAAMIDRHVPARSEQKEAKFEDLRNGLNKVANASRLEKCVFETNFEALLLAHDDQEAATNLIAKSSYEPYANCKPQAQVEAAAKRWYTWLGLVALVSGAIGMIRGRRDD